MTTNRSRLRPVLCLTGLSLVIAACGGGNGDEEAAADGDVGTINFYSPESPDMTEAMAQAFQEQVGGTVNVISGGTNVIVNRLLAEQDNPQGDLWYGGGGWMPFEAVIDDGILEPYTPGPAEDWEMFDGELQLHHEDWYWTGVDGFVLGLSYNTDLVDEADLPATWEELADERWEGEIQLPNPAASGTATLFVLSQMLNLGEDQAWEYFDAVVSNANAIPDSGSAPTQAVAQGEAQLGVAFEFMAYQQQARGESVDFHIPETTPVLVNPVALIADGPNPEGAKQFIDWMLGPEGQQVRADYQMLLLDEAEGVEQQIPLTIEDIVPHAMELDVDWVQENFDQVRNDWQNRYAG
jgi:iron(III) transport system substrate-binding protein